MKIRIKSKSASEGDPAPDGGTAAPAKGPTIILKRREPGAASHERRIEPAPRGEAPPQPAPVAVVPKPPAGPAPEPIAAPVAKPLAPAAAPLTPAAVPAPAPVAAQDGTRDAKPGVDVGAVPKPSASPIGESKGPTFVVRRRDPAARAAAAVPAEPLPKESPPVKKWIVHVCILGAIVAGFTVFLLQSQRKADAVARALYEAKQVCEKAMTLDCEKVQQIAVVASPIIEPLFL